MYGGADYFDAYAGEILRIALIETRLGMQNLEAIAATPGLDMIYLGPNDLGVSERGGLVQRLIGLLRSETLNDRPDTLGLSFDGGQNHRA